MENQFSLYIHIPFCISKCRYCDFYSVTDCFQKDHKISDFYISALCREIIFYKEKYNINNWHSIYIGGGTPSLLEAGQLNKIIETCGFTNNSCEFTIEVNPDDLSTEKIDEYKAAGINRISCGIQSLNQKSLEFASRRASLEQNLIALNLLKENFNNFSVDLICGLPFETKTTFLNGLKTILTFKPSHISMYSLTVEEETPFGELLSKENFDFQEEKFDKIWLAARDFLGKNLYSQYEVSNFYLKGKSNTQCTHNLVYWNHQNYIGCGCGATGTVYNSSGEGLRWTNTKKINDYIEFWNKESEDEKDLPLILENIDANTSKFEFFMMGLRKSDGISKNQYESIFKTNLPEGFLKASQRWYKNKLMEISEKKSDVIYRLNSRGILFLNKFLQELEL